MSTAEEKFYGNIYMLEIERAKFMLKSYLRARLAKVRACFGVTRVAD